MRFWSEALPYFTREELACKGTGIIKLDLVFASYLPALREKWGRPLAPTSVCRTPAHNRAVGGHPRSLHLTDNHEHPTNGTMAIDIAWRSWSKQERIMFARLAWREGWAIGLNNSFIHLDYRSAINLPRRIFTYGSDWAEEFSAEDIL